MLHYTTNKSYGVHNLPFFLDKLEKNLINDAIQRDKKNNINKPKSAQLWDNMEKLVEAISSSGVSFSIWAKRNADCIASELYEWTSMVGNEKKKVLKSLPDKLAHVLPTGYAHTITHVWKVMLSSPGWHQPGERYS